MRNAESLAAPAASLSTQPKPQPQKQTSLPNPFCLTLMKIVFCFDTQPYPTKLSPYPLKLTTIPQIAAIHLGLAEIANRNRTNRRVPAALRVVRMRVRVFAAICALFGFCFPGARTIFHLHALFCHVIRSQCLKLISLGLVRSHVLALCRWR